MRLEPTTSMSVKSYELTTVERDHPLIKRVKSDIKVGHKLSGVNRKSVIY